MNTSRQAATHLTLVETDFPHVGLGCEIAGTFIGIARLLKRSVAEIKAAEIGEHVFVLIPLKAGQGERRVDKLAPRASILWGNLMIRQEKTCLMRSRPSAPLPADFPEALRDSFADGTFRRRKVIAAAAVF